MKDSDNLTIGALAKQVGVKIDTVRFYERQGIIKQPPRKTSGFRYYSQDHAKRIRFVKRAAELGFTLKEIKELLDLQVNTRATCGDVKRKTDVKLAEVREKINDLQRMERSLKRLSSSCGGTNAGISQCPILDCFESGENQ